MARPAATPEQQEAVRKRIRDAAAALYRAEGLGAITARAIALGAGVSVGTIYAHFGDLATLMQSLWTGKVAQQFARLEDIAARHSDPVARLDALIRDYLRFGLDNASLYRNAFLFVRPESHAKPDAAALSGVAFSSLLIAAITEGQAAGRIVEGPPEQLAQILWSGVHGCLALPANIDRVAFAPPAQIAEAMAAALMRSLRTGLS